MAASPPRRCGRACRCRITTPRPWMATPCAPPTPMGATLTRPLRLAVGEQAVYVDTGDPLPAEFDAVDPDRRSAEVGDRRRGRDRNPGRGHALEARAHDGRRHRRHRAGRVRQPSPAPARFGGHRRQRSHASPGLSPPAHRHPAHRHRTGRPRQRPETGRHRRIQFHHPGRDGRRVGRVASTACP